MSAKCPKCKYKCVWLVWAASPGLIGSDRFDTVAGWGGTHEQICAPMCKRRDLLYGKTGQRQECQHHHAPCLSGGARLKSSKKLLSVSAGCMPIISHIQYIIHHSWSSSCSIKWLGRTQRLHRSKHNAVLKFYFIVKTYLFGLKGWNCYGCPRVKPYCQRNCCNAWR